jgi:N,N'-diacetylchitobiose non-reducing end deacetylase
MKWSENCISEKVLSLTGIRKIKSNNKKAVLAIGAHPDDIEFSCTGSLLKLQNQGYDIYMAVVTDGRNGFKAKHKPVEERVKIRKKEQLKVAELMGCKKIFFLNYKDGFLEYTEKLRKKLVAIIKSVKPQIIFSFDPSNQTYENINLLHRDHRIVAVSVFDAVFAAKNRYMYKGKPHQVNFLYLFGSHKPDYFEDISELIDKKLEILSSHKSQFSDFTKTSEWVRNYLSKFSPDYQYSEAFRLVEVKQIFK